MRYADPSPNLAAMRDRLSRLGPERLVGVALVVALHGAALYGASTYRVLAAPTSAAPVFVSFITAPAERADQPLPAAPKPVRLDKPRPVDALPPQQLAAAAAVAAEPLAPSLPSPVPAPAAPVAAPASVAAPAPVAVAAPTAPAGPVSLNEELSLSCPERSSPVYPPLAKRRGQTGQVVVRVELDESGRVVHTQVARSSGANLLDEAAQAAVRQWQCQPARRGGQPVRAVALQPFEFTL